MTYLYGPIDGLSDQQQKACEAAANLGGPAHDGLLRLIVDNLPGPAPWGDGAVADAIKRALTDAGVANPFLLGP